MIRVNALTLTYPGGKGIFDIGFSVGKGEVTGCLGPNGAGKTTTIRALLGFMRPNAGSCTIGGLDCLKDAPEIQKTLGYIPGEIAFPDSMRGDEFLDFMGKMRNMKDRTRRKQLTEMFELDPGGRIRKFSKGMKQKLGIIAAFMHDPETLILDEPTAGLDPLMQNRFIELILEEKRKGKTVFMSSHMFEEVEKTCGSVLIIREGRIVGQSDIQTLKSTQRKGFVIRPANSAEAVRILTGAGFETVNDGSSVEVFVMGENTDRFIKTAAGFEILGFDVKSQSLEDVFMKFYGTEEKV